MVAMARLLDVVFDARHPASTARFWAAVLDGYEAGKNRVHLDVSCDSVRTELERLTGLGASLVARYDDHVLLHDPEGNEFCLFGPW